MFFKAMFLSLATIVTTQAYAQGWSNQQGVVRAASMLQNEVEQFDESLHGINAPADLIQLVHHFEDTVEEFVGICQQGARQQAESEMQHIRQDFSLIRDKVGQYNWVTNYQQVATEYQHMRTAYRNLDHQMFLRSARWTSEAVAELEVDLAALYADHPELEP